MFCDYRNDKAIVSDLPDEIILKEFDIVEYLFEFHQDPCSTPRAPPLLHARHSQRMDEFIV